MEFKKITAADAEQIRPILSDNGEFSCESTFVNLLVWQEVYSNLFCTKDGTLFIKSTSDSGDVFRLPIGCDIKKGVAQITEYTGGALPTFWAQEGALLEQFKADFGNLYDFKECRDAFDYIYPREALSALSGKKYHSKRNHISAFSKKHDWHYEDISPENISAVKKCADEWYTENADRNDRYLSAERRGVGLMLDNMKTLNVSGGAILVGERVVAFTLASPINNRVFDIHIEKALSDYSEAYTVINREFASRLSEDFRYINREDDMGLEGLRKAKMSYKPEILLKKYYCIPKEKIIL